MWNTMNHARPNGNLLSGRLKRSDEVVYLKNKERVTNSSNVARSHSLRTVVAMGDSRINQASNRQTSLVNGRDRWCKEQYKASRQEPHNSFHRVSESFYSDLYLQVVQRISTFYLEKKWTNKKWISVERSPLIWYFTKSLGINVKTSHWNGRKYCR